LSKYNSLNQFLASSQKDNLTLSFKEIEEIIGFPLPSSATLYRAWWSNDQTHVQAENGWLSSGWQSTSINLNLKQATFEKQELAPTSEKQPKETLQASSPGKRFERIATQTMSSYFGKPLKPKKMEGWAKLFDLVSDDCQIVGDAKYLSMVNGERLPPAKFSNIAEHVWMLENTQAAIKFLVFGNDRRVPEEWLKRYGKLVKSTKFYFINEEGNVLELK